MYNNIFRIIREKNELTTRMVADILGISKSTYNYLENKNQFTISNLVNFCNYFHVSSDYALGLTDINQFNSKTNYKFDSKLFGNRLKEIRLKNNLTQAKLAKLLDINQSMISAYENNRSKMQGYYLYPLSKTLKVSSDYLVGLSNVYNRIPN